VSGLITGPANGQDGGMPLQITAAPIDPALLDLPWHIPLAEWPPERLVALPRGLSRHVVRFVRVGQRVFAVKEASPQLAETEYRLLRELERRGVPTVSAVGVIRGRTTRDGAPIDPVLMTRHLSFSLPYRALFSGQLLPETTNRLLDALVVLLVRLHLAGFYWGDCSLSNTLFRRDAGAFAAYLVDAETGELHPQLSQGQRYYDLDTAHGNVFGELLDLEAGGLLDEATDPYDTSAEVLRRYEGLWAELTGEEQFAAGERYRVDARMRRLNSLGFDVAELQLGTDAEGSRLVLQPKVVDAGHHHRRLRRLTGLDVQENQARRLLNDLDHYRATLAGRGQQHSEVMAAHHWLTEVFEPTVSAIPAHLTSKLEPAEFFHEVLEHRWFMSEAAAKDAGLSGALEDYLDTVLAHKPDEEAVLGIPASALAAPSGGADDVVEQE
jgi:hypothetical protein